MPKRKKKQPKAKVNRRRPSEIVMEESDVGPWDLQEHLTGCLAAFQEDQDYPSAVYFALEAIGGIARDVDVRANANMLDPTQLDKDWKLNPRAVVNVPWIWIAALAAAWARYNDGVRPLGHAFGLEGGQGTSPIIGRKQHLLDQRGIARWVWDLVHKKRTADPSFTITRAQQEVVVKFGKSDVTIKRAWERFGQLEKKRRPLPSPLPRSRDVSD